MRRWRGAELLLLVVMLQSASSGVDAMHAGCVPQWYTDQLRSGNGTDCPNGFRLPGDITWQDDLSWQVNVVCVIYGYVPMFVILIAVIEFLVVRGTRELSFVLFVAVSTMLNEAVFKTLLSQPRPSGSCCVSCGMPSSHCSFALGFFTLMWLDAAYRVNPMDVGGEAKHWCTMMLEKEYACVRGPLSQPVTLSNCAFVYTCILWGCLLLPVPLTRIALEDHTVLQASVGSTAGIAYAFLFFYGFYEPFAKKMARREAWRFPQGPGKHSHVLRNTIKLPWWRQEVRPCHLVITDSEPDDSLVYGRSLTAVDVPVTIIEDVDGNTRQVVHGQHLQVVGGNWSGVAWPIERLSNRPVEYSKCNSVRQTSSLGTSETGSSTDDEGEVDIC